MKQCQKQLHFLPLEPKSKALSAKLPNWNLINFFIAFKIIILYKWKEKESKLRIISCEANHISLWNKNKIQFSSDASNSEFK